MVQLYPEESRLACLLNPSRWQQRQGCGAASLCGVVRLGLTCQSCMPYWPQRSWILSVCASVLPLSLTFVETASVKCVLVLCRQLGVWVVGVLSVRVGSSYAGLVLFGCRALGLAAGNQRSGAGVMRHKCAPIYTAGSL